MDPTTVLADEPAQQVENVARVDKVATQPEQALTTSSPDKEALNRQLKKTCEACAKSKVKCEGGHPCERCRKRGVECEYILEQKRGRRMASSQERSNGEKRHRNSLNEDPHASSSPTKRPFNFSSVEAHKPTYLLQPHPSMSPSSVAFSSFSGPSFFPNPAQGWQSQSLVTFPAAVGGLNNGLPTILPQLSSLFPTGNGMLPSSNPLLNGRFILQNQVAESSLPWSLERLVRIFFSLYKLQKKQAFSSARKAWFDDRFPIVCSLLQRRLRSDDISLLNMWLRMEQIIHDSSNNKCWRANIPDFEWNKRRVDEVACKPGPRLGSVMLAFNGAFELSSDLVQNLGFTTIEIQNALAPLPILPFCGDVLAFLAYDEYDVLGFIFDGTLAMSKAKQSQEPSVAWKSRLSLKQKSGLRVDVVAFCELALNPVDGSSLGPMCVTVHLTAPESLLINPLPINSSLLAPETNLHTPNGLGLFLNWVSSA